MALSHENALKRFQSLNPSQDSVQTTSMWVLHYKDSVDVIVKSWMDVYRKADDNLRTSLIYVMNDVCQKANKKGRGEAITQAFHPYVVNAITLSSVKVKKAIGRCLEIFEQRKVFPSHVIEEMKNALDGNQGDETENDQDEGLLTEIEIAALIKDIESYRNGDVLMEKAREILARSDFNLKQQLQSRMKDRTEGAKMLTEMDASKEKLSGFLSTLENHQKKCQKLIKLMQNAKQFFTLQLRDVTIVDDAYEKFGQGIRQTKRELEECLTSGIFPGMSPPRDAPSPDANEDLNIEEVLKESNAGVEDMDVEDENDDLLSPSTSSMRNFVTPLPNVAPLDPRLQRMLHQQTQSVSSASNVSESPKVYIPPSPLPDPRQIRASFPLQQPMVSPPIRVDITQPPPMMAFMNQQQPRPPNLIDPRQQKHSQPPFHPHSPAVHAPPHQMFNPNNRPPDRQSFPQPNIVSPPVGNTPTTPNVHLPPGVMPNFSMPPPMGLLDTDHRVFSGQTQAMQIRPNYFNGPMIRPMNGGSSFDTSNSSDVPIPGVDDTYKPSNFNNNSRRSSFNSSLNR